MPRWATAFQFVIPTEAQRKGGTCSLLLMEKRNPEATRPRHSRLCPKVKLQVPPLRYPAFPVEVGGVGEPRAAFFTESRIRGLGGVVM